MGKYIYLFIGESGSGKTQICNRLAECDGMKQLWSYTTRKPRYDDEPGHIFVDAFPQDARCVAYTEFDGKQYWATQEQVDECDTYVVDPAGLEWFMRQNRGKTPIVFYLQTSRRTRKRRMLARGDSKEDTKRRLKHDKKEFKEFRDAAYHCSDTLPTTIIIDNNDDNDSGLQQVRHYIYFFEDGDLDQDFI